MVELCSFSSPSEGNVVVHVVAVVFGVGVSAPFPSHFAPMLFVPEGDHNVEMPFLCM